MVAKWHQGLTKLEQAVAKAPASRQPAARRELAIAQTCRSHFQSTANQIEFYLLRDGKQTSKTKQRMLEVIADEIRLSRSQYAVAKSESLIGYEASNHYYYTPLDLAEKILNCDWIARQLRG
jgi:hypothetical protein